MDDDDDDGDDGDGVRGARREGSVAVGWAWQWATPSRRQCLAVRGGDGIAGEWPSSLLRPTWLVAIAASPPAGCVFCFRPHYEQCPSVGRDRRAARSRLHPLHPPGSCLRRSEGSLSQGGADESTRAGRLGGWH